MHHHFDDRAEAHRARHWRKFEAMARRGFGGWGGFRGGPGGPGGMGGMGGDWGGFGDNLRIGRMLASGDLRLVALYFIEQQPRHGYDLIKAIEEKTGGIYVPSPGVIYPALTFLEEAGFVTSTAEGNKRLYTITEEGKTHLAENKDAVESTLGHLGRIGEQFAKMRQGWEKAERAFTEGGPDRDMDDVVPELNEARRDLKDALRAVRGADPEVQRRVADLLRSTAKGIRASFGGDRGPDIDL
ncbi:MAG: PadR family transcriptional regulator [Devosia sp.]